jgi:predicted N-acetyltransferase YhbS
MIQINTETAEDWWEVENLYDLSFAPGREALSSYRLRDDVPPVGDLCFVARDADAVLAGAIRYWPIEIGDSSALALLLGPVAVHPTRQGEGLGGSLIRHSLRVAQELGWQRVVLVGDFPYYSRFGFEKAPFLQYPPPTNPERLLALSLQKGAFEGVQGLIKSTKSVAIGPIS